MMNRTILYYPTMDIPNKSWLTHALLYYDEVSSIVPQSWDNNFLIELSSDIHYLIDEGQFRPMKPEDLVFNQANWDAFAQFKEEFTGIVSAPAYNNFGNERLFANYRIHRNKLEDNYTARIHTNKISDSVFDFLQDRGLVTRCDNSEWLMFEERTGLLYMALLAKYLADIDGNQTTIGTDLNVYERINFKRVSEEKGFAVVSLNLNKILPSPRANVPLEKIIDFKRRRADNLLHFKRILSDFQVRVSNTKSQAEFKEITINFRETLINGITDLNAVISDSKIETVLKGFKSLISLKSPTTLLAAGAALNDRFGITHIPFNWEAFSVGAMGMVEIASCYIEARNRERARLRESPFSYLYNANKYGIINRP